MTNPTNTYVVLDFETTGFSPTLNEIIQIGAIKYEGKKEVDRVNQLIKPRRSSVTPKITQVTGIRPADLTTAPTLDQVFPDFHQFISGQLIVGHNIGFDLGFLDVELTRFGINEYFKSYDTCSRARQQMPFLQNYKLSTIKYFFDMHLKSHDALNDCLITARLYQYLEAL